MKYLILLLILVGNVSSDAKSLTRQPASTKTAKAKPKALDQAKAFFLEGPYRKTNGGEECQEGELSLVQGTILRFGAGAKPLLFHAFDKNESLTIEGCTTTTKTTTKSASKTAAGASHDTFTVEETITQKCGKDVRKMKHTLAGDRHHGKIELVHTSTDSVKGKTPLTCRYERALTP